MDKFQVNSKVEEFIDKVALQNLRRLSPHYVANQVGISEIDLVFAALMRLADYKVRVKYEVQCVECGSGDFVVYDKNNIKLELKECRVCYTEYVPDEDKIWVTFDITPEFRETIKEKSDGYRLDANDFFNNAGYSLKKARKNNNFSHREDFYSNWSINIEQYKILLNKVKTAPQQRKEGNLTTRQQGDTLEELVMFLFNSAPNFFEYKGNIITDTSEIDGCTLILSDKGFLNKWPPYNLSECKNWMSAVDKDSLESFIGKVSRANQHTGILFSRMGITGEKAAHRRAAQSLIYSAVDKGIIIMIITLDDLIRIRDGENFLNILAEKYRNTTLINA